jgi:hypothetical protein
MAALLDQLANVFRGPCAAVDRLIPRRLGDRDSRSERLGVRAGLAGGGAPKKRLVPTVAIGEPWY